MLLLFQAFALLHVLNTDRSNGSKPFLSTSENLSFHSTTEHFAPPLPMDVIVPESSEPDAFSSIPFDDWDDITQHHKDGEKNVFRKQSGHTLSETVKTEHAPESNAKKDDFQTVPHRHLHVLPSRPEINQETSISPDASHGVSSFIGRVREFWSRRSMTEEDFQLRPSYLPRAQVGDKCFVTGPNFRDGRVLFSTDWTRGAHMDFLIFPFTRNKIYLVPPEEIMSDLEHRPSPEEGIKEERYYAIDVTRAKRNEMAHRLHLFRTEADSEPILFGGHFLLITPKQMSGATQYRPDGERTIIFNRILSTKENSGRHRGKVIWTRPELTRALRVLSSGNANETTRVLQYSTLCHRPALQRRKKCNESRESEDVLQSRKSKEDDEILQRWVASPHENSKFRCFLERVRKVISGWFRCSQDSEKYSERDRLLSDTRGLNDRPSRLNPFIDYTWNAEEGPIHFPPAAGPSKPLYPEYKREIQLCFSAQQSCLYSSDDDLYVKRLQQSSTHHPGLFGRFRRRWTHTISPDATQNAYNKCLKPPAFLLGEGKLHVDSEWRYDWKGNCNKSEIEERRRHTGMKSDIRAPIEGMCQPSIGEAPMYYLLRSGQHERLYPVYCPCKVQ